LNQIHSRATSTAHADFMAGWAFARAQKRKSDVKVDTSLAVLRFFHKIPREEAVRMMFSAGDTKFNDKGHHGEPQLRAVMVRAGFREQKSDAKEAFDRGWELVPGPKRKEG
jgi:hypothetical protein